MGNQCQATLGVTRSGAFQTFRQTTSRITSSLVIIILVIISIVIFSNDNLANNYYIPGLLLLQDQASLLIFSNNNFQLAYAAGFLMISLPLMNVNETRRRKKHEKNSKKDTETWGEFMSHYWDG